MAGVLASLKIMLSADSSKMQSGLNEAEVKAKQSSRKLEYSFHRLGSVFARLVSPISPLGREISAGIDVVGASAGEANKALSSMGSTFALVGGIGAGALAALAGLTIKLFNDLDRTAHAAEGVGMGIVQYTELTSALKIYDVNQQQANEAMAYFEKILSGLVRSKAGVTAIQDLSRATKDSSLNLANLQKMNPHAALLKLADAFSKVADGSLKSGAAAALFGTTVGMKVLPFLDLGAAGVEALESQYKGLGEATQANARAANDLRESWSTFTANLESASLRIASFFRIPVELEAFASPLKTIQAAFWGWDEAVLHVARDIEVVLSHIPGFRGSAHALLSVLNADLQIVHAREAALANVFYGSDKGTGGGSQPPTGVSPNGNNVKGVVAALAKLHDEVADFGKGDVATGIDALKRMGATAAQLKVAKSEYALLDLEKSAQQAGLSLSEFERIEAHLNNTKDNQFAVAWIKSRERMSQAEQKLHDALAATRSQLIASIAKGAGPMQVPGMSGGALPLGFGIPTLQSMSLASVVALGAPQEEAQQDYLKKISRLSFESLTKLATAFPNLSEAEVSALPAGQKMIDQLTHLQKHGKQTMETFSDLKDALIAEGSDFSGSMMKGLQGMIGGIEGGIAQDLVINRGPGFNFGKLAQRFEIDMITASLKKVTSTALSGLLGVGGKPDGSAGNPIYVRNADATGAPGGTLAGTLLGKLGGLLGLKNSGIGNALGSIGSSIFGALFSGARAVGGPVTAGELYMVGERGPEAFVPGASGRILPSGTKFASARPGNVINIDARGADAGVEARVMRAMAMMMKRAPGVSLAETYEYHMRGGLL